NKVITIMKKAGLLIISLMIVISCSDSFTTLSPISKRNVKNFYQTEGDFEVAINGVYGALQVDGTYNQDYILMFEMRADNTENDGGATGLAKAYQMIDKFSMQTDNTYSADAWSATYEGIARANKILAELKNTDIDPAVADRIKGEALFLRSLFYYNLAILFGNVPLQLKPVSDVISIKINHVDADAVYKQIAADLEKAVDLLPAGYSSNQVGMATSGAAATLLGKVYLTMGDNGKAETTLREVIGDYQLVDNYSDLWGPKKENNKESIFEIQFKTGGIGEGSKFTDIYTPFGTAG